MNQKTLVIYSTTLVSLQFYSFYAFDDRIIKLLAFVLMPIILFYARKEIFRTKHSLLEGTLRYFFFSTFISIAFAWVFWNQSLMLGYRASAPILIFYFYFLLKKMKVEIEFIEKYIVAFGLLYCIIWLLAIYKAPMVMFGYSSTNEISDFSRGFLRTHIVGVISLVLSYFLVLNKCFTSQSKIYILIVVLLFIIIVLQLTRQLILWSGLITILYIFHKSKKIIIATSLLIIISVPFISAMKLNENSVVGSLIALTEEQHKHNKAGEENIRITAARYFFTEFSPSILTDIFGNGQPHADSSYGKYYERLNNRGFYLSDVGYARVYIVNGIIGLLFLLFLFTYSLKIKIPNELDYTKLFMLFMLLSNTGADWYAKADGQICICICIYIIEKYRIRENEIQYSYSRLQS